MLFTWMKDIDSTIIVALIMGIPTILLIISQAKNRKAEVGKLLTETYSNLIKDLKEELDRLSEKVDQIEEEKTKEINALVSERCELENLVDNLNTILKEYVKVEGDLRTGVVILRNQLIALKEIPLYNLPEELHFDVIQEEKKNE